MARIGRLVDVCSECSLPVGFLAGTAAMVANWLVPSVSDYLYESRSLADFASFSLERLAGSAAYGVGAAGLLVGPRILSKRLRLSDFRRMRRCWTDISERTCSFDEGVSRSVGLSFECLAGYFSADIDATEDPFLLIEYAERFARKGRFDDSCIALKKAFEDGAEFHVPVWHRVISFLSPPIARWNSKLVKYLFPASVGKQFAAAATLARYDKLDAWRHSLLARSIADELDDYRAEAYVMHALFASALGAETAVDDWCEAADVLRGYDSWEKIGESRRIVRVFKDSEFVSRSISFTDDSLEGLINEKQTIEGLGESLGSEASFPEVFFISEGASGGAYFSVKRFLEGDTLLERLENNDKSSVMRVVELLAKIHVQYRPHDEELSIPFYLKSRLLSEHLNIPRQLAKKIVHSYRPVYDALKYQPFVFNKDGHPDNWVVGKHKIGIIDCERGKLVPAQFDLVNLLCYGDFFNVEEQREYVCKYLDCVEDEGLIIERSSFMLGYWNAVVHRMIGLTSAWSSPLRPGLHIKRKEAMHRAVDAVGIIERFFPEYYSIHERSYLALKKHLGDIEASVFY